MVGRCAESIPVVGVLLLGATGMAIGLESTRPGGAALFALALGGTTYWMVLRGRRLGGELRWDSRNYLVWFYVKLSKPVFVFTGGVLLGCALAIVRDRLR